MKIQYDKVRQFLDRDPVIVLIGQSGCGKETLGKKILHSVETFLPEKKFFFSETGDLFRNGIPTFSEKTKAILKETQNAGKRQPACIASTLWIHNILMRYTGGPILIDGSPRSVDEAKTMKEFFCDFLDREVFVFYISVTDEECKRRILARNELHKIQNREVRVDCSTVDRITEKLRWFHTDVMPAIQHLEKAPGICVFTIHSDQKTTPDQVYEEAMYYLR